MKNGAVQMGRFQTNSNSVDVSILLIQEDNGWWSAQCLEYDLAAQARSLPDVLYEFEKTLMSHIAVHEDAGIDPFEDLPEAPKEYWEMYNQARANVLLDSTPFRASPILQHKISRRSMRVADRRAA